MFCGHQAFRLIAKFGHALPSETIEDVFVLCDMYEAVATALLDDLSATVEPPSPVPPPDDDAIELECLQDVFPELPTEVLREGASVPHHHDHTTTAV